MSILAVVSVAGLVFAFNNFNRDQDVYANITTSVDNDNIQLEIEVEENADGELQIVDSASRVGYFTITVGGLPDYLKQGRLLAYNPRVEGGILSDIEEVSYNASTGATRFRVTAQNGGQVRLLFTTIAGNREVYVNVKVVLKAKYVNLAKGAHFGVMQGGTLDLNKSDARAKLAFYAHEKDTSQFYKPTDFSQLTFALAGTYPGITLQDGVLRATELARAREEIGVLVSIAGMTKPVKIPVYVFAAMGDITVSSTAFQPDYTDVEYYDLILNRTGMDSAVFDFSVPDYGKVGESYDFNVLSQESSLVSVERDGVAGRRNMWASSNLGVTAITITAYPIATMTVDGVPNQRAEFKDAIDANVQVSRTIYVRVRNEFVDQNENILQGKMFFSKEEINAFHYTGTENTYLDEFTINTVAVSINYDNDIEFELVVNDTNGDYYSGVVTNTGYYNQDGVTLKKDIGEYKLNQILDIRILDNAGKWVQIATMNNRAHYRSQFAIAFIKNPSIVEPLLSGNITMYLRAKSVAKLSTNQYATSQVLLSGTRAIDDFAFDGLNDAGEIALVYNAGYPNRAISVDVRGVVQGKQTTSWNIDKVDDNMTESSASPFKVEKDSIQDGVITYTFSLGSLSGIAYYQAYPFTLTYPNGVTRTINVRVYPYAETLNMNVVSENGGVVYKTVKDQDNVYIQTVFVRIGANYRISVDTPQVDVGAKTDFDFNADVEGWVTKTVRLSAYNDDVFRNRELEFTVSIIVVNPIRSVKFVLPNVSGKEITLSGIGKPQHVDIDVSLMSDTNNPYENLYIQQIVDDPNVEVTKLSIWDGYGFDLAAKYLTTDPVVLGFKIYKVYDYKKDFNNDGLIDEKDTLELAYIAGRPVEIQVKIQPTNLIQEIKAQTDDRVVVNARGLGNQHKYLSIVADNADKSFTYSVSQEDPTANTGVDVTLAKWQDGQFNVTDLKLLQIDNVVKIRLVGSEVIVTPEPNATSLGEYAVVIYPLDSLTLVHGVVTPNLKASAILPLYIGDEKQINDTIDRITTGVHDANSGIRNNFGGYNWIVAGDKNTAILFYTTPVDEAQMHSSDIVANQYYLDDLYTVLGWSGLIDDNPSYQTKFNLEKHVNGVKVWEKNLPIENNRRYIKIETDDVNLEGGDVITYILRNDSSGTPMTFYPVVGITRFNVEISGETGLAASKTLRPDSMPSEDEAEKEFENTVKVQRGVYFEFATNIAEFSRWKVDPIDTDDALTSDTNFISYPGKVYRFTPYIELGGLTFTVTGLTATVRVEVYGGVDYLNIAQRSTTINGAVGAIYDITLKVDRDWRWDRLLLDYWFVYNGVSYPLFTNVANEHIATYVSMEGGSAGFYWQLTCLNPGAIRDNNNYFTYYFRLDVSIIIEATALDPFRDINNAEIIVREDFDDLPLSRERVEASAYLNVKTQTVTAITIKHFANTIADKETGDLSLPINQTDTADIYIDANISGGVLKVYPTPYYISLDSITLTSKSYVMDVVIGQNLRGEDIKDQVRYSIGFTQLIYNQDTRTYQTFLSGNSYRMVSSWSAKSGYQWDGVYYFKTFLKYDGNPKQSLPEATPFPISVTIVSDGQSLTQTMTLYARYKDGITVTPGTGSGSAAVGTMIQTRYQALGTTAVYDVAFPTDYTVNYSGYTVVGNGAAYAKVTLDTVAKTLRVTLDDNAYAINSQLEIRIPYKAQSDFVNPYLSVVIVPVYFEVTSFRFANHPEYPLVFTEPVDVKKLTLRAVTKYNANLDVDMNAMLSDFNASLNNSDLVNRYNSGAELTINTTFSYINGLPVITQNGEIMLEKVFKYQEPKSAGKTVTLNQAIGLTKQYSFDTVNKNNLSRVALSGGGNSVWDAQLQSNGTIEVSLDYDANLIGKSLRVDVYSRYDNQNPEITLYINPVYFTFDGFKLQNYPVNPLIALSKPFVVTLEAANVEYYQGTDIAITNAKTMVQTFNQSLATAEEIRFSQVAGDALNFNFDTYKREITRVGDVTANSYLKVSASIVYSSGVPTIANNGENVTTIFTVKTYGGAIGENGPEESQTPSAPTTRTMRVAQAIGRERTYNIALVNVNYDSTLDKIERMGSVMQAWSSDSKWNAVLNGNQITVTLAADTSLFGKILQISVYSQEDYTTPVYNLYITPTWFTVESLTIAGHPERPIWIVAPETVDDLQLDFVADYDPSLDADAMQARLDQFRKDLNDPLVLRTADNGILSIMTGLTFNNGLPTISSVNNPDALIVRSDYAYKLFEKAPGPLSRAEAQVIGEEVAYTLDLGEAKINKISAKSYDAARNTWWDVTTFNTWRVESDGVNTVKVKLNNDLSLIGQQFKVEIYTDNATDVAFALYITPAYFVVEDLAVAGQSGHDVWIITPDTPQNVALAGVTRGDTTVTVGGASDSALAIFNAGLNSADVVRSFNQNGLTGELRVKAYLRYENGVPVVVTGPNEDAEYDPLLLEINTVFTYTIYSDTKYVPGYPDLPKTPRTRTEVQAIGTTARYKIDLAKDVAVFTDTILQDNDRYEAKWEGDEVVVTLKFKMDMVTQANQEIKLNLYSILDTREENMGLSSPIFVLTIQPVLFEVKGFEVIGHPERPIRLSSVGAENNIAALRYSAVVNYDRTHETDVKNHLATFNTYLANQVATGDTRYFQYATATNAAGNRYLTVRAGLNYVSGATMPSFCNIENNPTKVVETTFAYKLDGSITNEASYVQAIGTTEYYTVDTLTYDIGTYKFTCDSGVTAKFVENSKVIAVTLNDAENIAKSATALNVQIQNKDNNAIAFTLRITPVLFVVEGFEVLYHPEHPLWLVVPEKIADLKYSAKVKYKTDSAAKAAITLAIADFNEYLQNQYAGLLTCTTAGSEYLTVSAAIEYRNGVPVVVDMAQAALSSVVKSTFQYKMYNNSGNNVTSDSDAIYPTKPKSLTKAQAIGLTKKYHIDLPDLSAYGNANSYIVEETLGEGGQAVQTRWTSFDKNGWAVSITNNYIEVRLSTDTNLLNKYLTVYIYYAVDNPNPAFVLNIIPVYFTVTDFAVEGHPEEPIVVPNGTTLGEFEKDLRFNVVAEYSSEVAGIKEIIKEFNDSLYGAPQVMRKNVGPFDGVNYYTVTASISYTKYNPRPQLSNNYADRISHPFAIVLGETPAKQQKTVVQALGTTQTYTIDLNGLDTAAINREFNHSAEGWFAKVVGNEVTVTLYANRSLIGKNLEIQLGNQFTLFVTPVYFEILGLEIVGHPERPLWLFVNNSTANLVYRARTNEIPDELDLTKEIAAFNASLVEQRNTLLSETTKDNKYLILRVAVDYQNGLPVIVPMTNDQRNVVEEIVEYEVWADSKRPSPEHPPVMGSSGVMNQIIGDSKGRTYALGNINGKMYYQYLWVEGAGNLTGVEDALRIYQGATVGYVPSKNTLTVQLRSNNQDRYEYLGEVIRIYIPYLTTVNGAEIWYSYCLEIRPVLFEVLGLKMEAHNAEHEPEQIGNYIYLKNGRVGYEYSTKFVLITSQGDDESLAGWIASEIARLEETINKKISLIDITHGYDTQNIVLEKRYNEAKQEDEYYLVIKNSADYVNSLYLTLNVDYTDGVPTAVMQGGVEATSEVQIFTGSKPTDFPPGNAVLGRSTQYQIIGTTDVYAVNISGVDVDDEGQEKIYYDQITTTIATEIADLVDVVANPEDKTITVNLTPNANLSNYEIEVAIPYEIGGAKYNYLYVIRPILYRVEGFTLVGYPNNNVDLVYGDVAVELALQVTRSTSASLRNYINLAIADLENQINTYIHNSTTFESWEIVLPNSSTDPNFEVLYQSGQMLLRKLGNEDATGALLNSFTIGYQNGLPVFNAGLNQTAIPVQIMVNTVEEVGSFFPGMSNIVMGDNAFAVYNQAVGTSRTYTINTKNSNQTFYMEYFVARNAGPLRGPKQYEYVDVQWVANESSIEIVVSLTTDLNMLSNTIEICIPYTEQVDGATVWRYYSLSIKPALFEINGWGIKQGDKILNEITLGANALEIEFAAKITSAPLNNTYFTEDALTYIKAAIAYVNKQLNQYDTSIVNTYRNLFITDTPAENSQVNYIIYRDFETEVNYIVRDVIEPSTTIMQVSANVTYETQGNWVIGASHPTIGFGQMIYDTITVITNGENIGTETVITQENAYLLANLSANTNYIIMSDIELSKIPGYENGWVPAAFPANTTLDGNNYRIFLDNGFDLSSHPAAVGLFSTVSSGAVLKNIQVVIPAVEGDIDMTQTNTLQVDLNGYASGNISIGVLAGVNQGIITNCAVLSEWQFMLNTYNMNNPMSNDGSVFNKNLFFNADGYLIDDEYYYQVGLDENNQITITKVFDSTGVLLVRNDNGQWIQKTTGQGVIAERMTLVDKTIVANYENHSAMYLKDEEYLSAAKLLVTNSTRNFAANGALSIVLGGLVGTNNYMVTNSRVLIDVELDGPETTTSAGESVEPSAQSTMVGGFVGTNTGTVTSSFFRDGNVIDNAYVGPMGSGVTCYFGGFVGYNQAAGIIMQSYAMGKSTDRMGSENNYVTKGGTVKTIRNQLGGFVYQNAGTIQDCIVTMHVNKLGEGLVGGFVYQNARNATITNCIENNYIDYIQGTAYSYYLPFFVLNDTMTDAISVVSYENLNNVWVANDHEYETSYDGTKLPQLTHGLFNDITQFAALSIGLDDGNNEWGVSAANTIWQMTDQGPRLRVANDIAISFRRYKYAASIYLFNPGTERNPYLIWNQNLFKEYVYSATATAVEADQANNINQNIERNRQGNHLRMVDNITLNTIPDTYKIIYTGTFEGNGLSMSGINLPSVSGNYTTIGLFGKLEYATIRNIRFVMSSVGINAYQMRYVGGLAGISINTNYVDVVMDGTAATTVVGGNIVGGIAGVTVFTDPTVQVYNVTSNISVHAAKNNSWNAPGDSYFNSGIEYYRQTLYSVNDNNVEQSYSTAGGIFGFVTSNPNIYRVEESGNSQFEIRHYNNNYKLTNSDAPLFLKDELGNVIGNDVYYTNAIVLRQVGGSVKNITAAVAGGLIGIMDESIELRDSRLSGLNALIGKYYLGGLVGINLGKISGGSLLLSSFNARSVVTNNNNSEIGSNYIYASGANRNYPGRYWGMTIGAVAGYNDGYIANANSGVIENLNVNVNMLSANTSYMYIVGGVVGVNGTQGYINPNAYNVRYSESYNSNIILNNTANVGFYFGNVVGRGHGNIESGENVSYSDTENTKTQLIEVALSSFVDANNFKTPGLKDANQQPINGFNVEPGVTHKVQTLTLQEYQSYMLNSMIRKNIPDRVADLEHWYRALPVESAYDETINGDIMRVERPNSTALNNYLKWVKDNNILSYSYNGNDYSEQIYNDYDKYVTYSATTKNTGNKDDVAANLKANRAERAAMAIEFFTYKIRTYGGAAGAQNLDFRWDQYENYRYVCQYAVTTDTNSEKVKDSLPIPQTWVYPYRQTVEYYKEIDSENGSETYKQRTISNNAALLSLLQDAANNANIQFTENDPLQAYINYLVEYGTHKSMFSRGSSSSHWVMSLSQYYYYIVYIKPNAYGLSEPKSYYYTAEEYADYLYANQSMSDTGNHLTLDEYIDFARNDRNKIIDYEMQWVITGHVVNDEVVSKEPGVRTMNWVKNTASWNPETDRDKVTNDGSVITYTDTNENTPVIHEWRAVEEYFNAQNEQGLTIKLYEDIRRLGGSLYELRKIYPELMAEEYVLTLQGAQYGWSKEQTTVINDPLLYGPNNIKWALAATFYGHVTNYTLDTARVVDRNRGGTLGFDLSPENMNDTYRFKGDDRLYKLGRSIDLTEHGNIGAALYLDLNGDKMFNPEDDTLVVYQTEDEDYDLYVENGNVKTFYKISRYIMENDDIIMNVDEQLAEKYQNYNLTIGEQTKNHSDFLEEALWWKDQGFAVNDFEDIKCHVLAQKVNLVDYYVTKNGTVPQVTYAKETYEDVYHQERTRYAISRLGGFTLADDWDYAENQNTENPNTFGFKNEGNNKFSTSEYLEIVLATEFTGLDDWSSKYAEFKLFERIYDAADTKDADLLDVNDLPNTAQNLYTIPDPFGTVNKMVYVNDLAPETVLADAIGFSNNKMAYLTMAQNGGSVADYLQWATKDGYKVTPSGGNGNNKYYFRLNHYIYIKKNQNLNLENRLLDFVWTLKQSGVRDQIFYQGVKPEDKTTELLEYRIEWYNDGNPFMTFRDYCEWINVYAHGDEYAMDRGDLSMGDDESVSDNKQDAWLDIYAFAVWKRMEKYENNTEYMSKIGQNSSVTSIETPIYKRQISTTVFPKIQSSGNVDTADLQNRNPKLPSNLRKGASNFYAWSGGCTVIKSGHHFGSGGYIDNKEARTESETGGYTIDSGIFAGRQRHWLDRFEYNEQYVIVDMSSQNGSVKSIAGGAVERVSFSSNLVTNFAKMMPATPYSTDCDDSCGGKNTDGSYTGTCTNPNHGQYQMAQWVDTYGYYANKSVNGWFLFWSATEYYGLTLDEVTKEDYDTEKDDGVTKKFAQLYVPFEYFKAACKRIQDYYRSQADDMVGYRNYMRYWAKNGSRYWISGLDPDHKPDEFPVKLPTYAENEKGLEDSMYSDVNYYWVVNNYAAKNFWINFENSIDEYGYAVNPIGKKEKVNW